MELMFVTFTFIIVCSRSSDLQFLNANVRNYGTTKHNAKMENVCHLTLGDLCLLGYIKNTSSAYKIKLHASHAVLHFSKCRTLCVE